MHHSGGYGSEFEESSSGKKRKGMTKDDVVKTKLPFHGHSSKIPSKSTYVDAFEKEERKSHFAQFLSMSAIKIIKYARHQKLVHDYIAYYGGKIEDFKRDSSSDKTDFDVIKENHKFVWDEHDDSDSWGKKLAKKYYDKLFKEYCICDLSRYKENKLAMRWRIEKEVVEGKGQFVCATKKCTAADGLKTWEVNFGYNENNEKKNALVKLRLCPDCSYKLNYHHKHKQVRKKKKKNRKKKSKKKKKKYKVNKSEKEDSSSSSPSSSEDDDEEEKEEDSKKKPGPSSRKITDDGSIWSKPVTEEVEKSREEEFDSYLEDLFL